MTENAKAFLEKAGEDEEFLERLKKARTKDAVIELAKEKGFELTEEDLKSEISGKQALSDDELDAVAGGTGCFCLIAGAGVSGDGDNNYCGCFAYGEGLNNRAQNCDCHLNGSGDNVSNPGKGDFRFQCYGEGDSLFV